MENASKALLMAGGILIALLILGALILLMTNLQSYQRNNDEIEKNAQIAEFNSQFEPYNKDNLTLMEIKSVYNKLESHNAQHPEYKIEHNIEDVLAKKTISVKTGVVDMTGTEKTEERHIPVDEFKNSFKTLEDTFKQKARFNCTGIKYENPEGRISGIFFE